MKILTVVGTRPDAIKLLPVHIAAKAAGIESILCATAQHIGMLDQVLTLFDITPDYNLQVMQTNQDLFHVTTAILSKIKIILEEVRPDLVVVQGDTTTSFAAALAAFYLKIQVAHVEAGLRTGSIHAPFPEEMNRKFIGMVASYHFAATSLNVANLLGEGVDRTKIILTGNTVVDALHTIVGRIKNGLIPISSTLKDLILSLKMKNKRIVLLTAHRRESFDGGLLNIFNAVKEMALTFPELAFIYPHHPNPLVQKTITESGLETVPGIHLLPPLVYSDLVYCLLEAEWVATDSGGIQEEAISLGKPVVVLRTLTERIEGVWAGVAELAGTDTMTILECMKRVHATKPSFSSTNIYGDGQASKKIASFIGTIRQESHHAIGVNMPIQQQRPKINTNP